MNFPKTNAILKVNKKIKDKHVLDICSEYPERQILEKLFLAI